MLSRICAFALAFAHSQMLSRFCSRICAFAVSHISALFMAAALTFFLLLVADSNYTPTPELRQPNAREPAATFYEHDRDERIRRNNQIMAKLGLPVHGGEDHCGVDNAFDGGKVTKRRLARLNLTSSRMREELQDSEDQAGNTSEPDYLSDSSEDSDEMIRVTLGTRKENAEHRQRLFREAEEILCLRGGRG